MWVAECDPPEARLPLASVPTGAARTTVAKSAATSVVILPIQQNSLHLRGLRWRTLGVWLEHPDPFELVNDLDYGDYAYGPIGVDLDRVFW